MKKISLIAGVFVLMGSYGYAQTATSNDNGSGTNSTVQGSVISNLAQTTTVTGKQKGILISSAARAQALTVANAHAKFLSGHAKTSNSSTSNGSANSSASSSANVSAVVSANPTANGKPSTLPPVSPPTMGQPVTTPVGKPMGVPVGVHATTHISVGIH